jgi:hypothetical protein
MRWGSIVWIAVVAVISAGAVLAIANGGGRDGASSSDGGNASVAGLAAPTAGGGVAEVDDAAKALRDEGTAPTASGSGLGGLPTPELRAQVVKRATVELEVGRRKGDATVRDVIDAVGLVGGFVESTDQSDRRSRLTVRVPADQFDATLERLLGLGRERGLEVHGQDVTGAVTDLEARLRNLRAQEGVLIELMRKAATIGDSIAVQQQLSQNQEQIEQLEGQRRVLADQTTYATLVVSITPLGAPPANADSPTTLGSAWADGVDAALAVTGGTLVVLGALLPILVIAGLGILVWRVVVRRQRRANAPAPATP